MDFADGIAQSGGDGGIEQASEGKNGAQAPTMDVDVNRDGGSPDEVDEKSG